jgi:four helix bundle protein
MPFDAYDRSLELLRTLAPHVTSIASADGSLADQLRRAAASVPLNIAEGNRRTGRDKANRFRIALGSAAEVAACLDVGCALGYLDASRLTAARELVDRVRAMTYRLSRP